MSTLNSELTANPYQADQKRNEVKAFTYDRWMESVGIPIHRGFFIEDLRTVELGWWDERQCDAAFIQLTGQEGITSAIVMEIAPGKSLPPMKFALDELIYVLQGHGVSTVWSADGAPKKTFEWQDRSLFHVASNSNLQLANMRGDKPVRLLRYSYLPLATSLITEPQFYFNNPIRRPLLSPKKAKPTPKPSLSKTATRSLPGAAVGSTGTATFSPTWRRGTSSRPTRAVA
jgi:hypothetical protein